MPIARALIGSVIPLLASLTLGAQDPRFLLLPEIYGRNAYTDPAVDKLYQNGMANGITFHDPANAGMGQDLTGHPGTGFIFHMLGATKVKGSTAEYIESQRQAVATICGALGQSRAAWNAMPEWDQSGGNWVPGGRPRYSRLTRAQAYERFTGYYLNDCPPLGIYLRQTAAQRGCRLLAQTDYAPNAFYAYEMGVDAQMLERAIDELGDIATGLAYIRGAGKQYGRPWGIDLSTWRTSANSATSYNAADMQMGGWSADYLRRHLFAAYMAGAQFLQIEATIYFHRDGRLNPFGQMVKEFGNFALTRHPEIGTPAVTTGLMMDFNAGFDPKHGPWNQADAIWYQDIPYSEGDYMINNLLKTAYPNHWLHGTTPGAPFTAPSGYRQFLAEGGDPRPYEPMPSTRWGDCFDVILNNAGPAVLDQYAVIILTGSILIDDSLGARLHSWVQRGGTLVVNSSQVTTADQSLLGIQLSGTMKSGSSSRWLADNSIMTEPAFHYRVVTPTTASVLATDNDSDALVTSNAAGRGHVILTTPAFLQSGDRSRLLFLGVKLLDVLQDQHAVARVSGPPIHYLVSRDAGRLIITLLNHSGTIWNGSVSIAKPARAYRVLEWGMTSDTAVGSSESNGNVIIPTSVPPYNVRIYCIQT